MMLSDHIHEYRDVLDADEYFRLLRLLKEFEFPDFEEIDDDAFYGLHGHRQQIDLKEGEVFDIVDRAFRRTMPMILDSYRWCLPDGNVFDKYSGYWLCKYPEGSGISYHADLDGDAGSVTASYAINDDYEGGELRFWKELSLGKESNSVHIYPSNFLYPHEVTPVTKGTRYSIVCWFGYQKGQDWS